jgi:hypothetical protein
VEVDRVSAHLEGLTNVGQLDIHNLSDCFFFTEAVFFVVAMDHDVCSILVLCGSFWVTPKLDVSTQKTDFSTHVNEVLSISFSCSIVLVEEWSI